VFVLAVAAFAYLFLFGHGNDDVWRGK
jgi:hypothetical protein